jgi:uncharacterized protein YhfF
MKSFAFGNTPEMNDQLLDLVLKGKKTATSWAAKWGREDGGQIGERSVILDSKGNKRVVIETVEVVKKPFSQVDESFAGAEGEGDLSLDHWRTEHERFFRAEDSFSPEMEVYCEKFKVIEILPQAGTIMK